MLKHLQRAATVKEQIVEVRKNKVAIGCESVAEALKLAKEAAGKDGVIVWRSLFTVVN